jgi:Domain of unknown function (DUF4124)
VGFEPVPEQLNLMAKRPQKVLLAIAFALLAAAAAEAQSKPGSGHEAFFRCKDASGQTHYSDSLPSACMGFDTEVLNERGMLVRIIEGERTRAARLEREAVENKARKEREVRALRDRTLIDTYLTVADIERLRDQRIELLVSQYKVTEQSIKNLRERQTRLEQQIERFKPYSDKSNAPPLPDHLAEEMVNLVNGARVYAESLTKNKQEQAEVKASFEADIRRFKELKGLK